jgi:hypothetical protein
MRTICHFFRQTTPESAGIYRPNNWPRTTLRPARGPPQTEVAMGPAGGEAEEAARESFPDDLDQSPELDPAEPEPIPEGHFDQSWSA